MAWRGKWGARQKAISFSAAGRMIYGESGGVAQAPRQDKVSLVTPQTGAAIYLLLFQLPRNALWAW
ncbi:MAG: hypothetical protein SFW35_04875 [Chitinophagales bacterium]|nr:hypothetical protein [Chitinophagales bacterium]